MTPEELTRAATLAESLASWAIVRTRGSRASLTRFKSNEADFVTDTDLSIEMWVRTLVAQTFPAHGFIGEEFGATEERALTWYCDPIDGTTNYATGVPWHSFSLALCDADGPLVGVVADPRTQEVFKAVRGQGATLNGAPLTVARRSGLASTVVLTEWLGSLPWPGQLDLIERLGRACCTTRVMGSSTLTLAGLAAGRGQGGIIGEFGPVDLLAAVLICHEAGLVVRDESGAVTLFPERGGIMVANPGLADELHALWRDCVEHAG